MRKLSLIILALIGVTFFYSCEDDLDPVMKLESNITISPLEEGDFEPVLSDDIADSVFTVFSWEPPQYNVDIVNDYVVEVDTAGNNFENAAEVASVSDTNRVSLTVFEFNKILTKDLGIPADKEVSVEVRVGSIVGKNQTKRMDYSESISISVETYEPPFEPEELYIHGTDGPLGSILPVEDAPDGTYEGYIYIPAGGDEIRFGDEAGDKILGNDNPEGPDDDLNMDNQLYDNQGAIPVDSGYYRIRANTYSNTYDMFITHWGVIGSAIDPYDWTAGIAMTYHPEDDIWTVEVEAQDGEFKFRPNETWDPLNYGDDGGNGIPNEYGANIPISSGTKKITLDLSEYPYSYSIEDAK